MTLSGRTNGLCSLSGCIRAAWGSGLQLRLRLRKMKYGCVYLAWNRGEGWPSRGNEFGKVGFYGLGAMFRIPHEPGGI